MSKQKRNFRYVRINGEVILDPFDDKEMRELFIDFAGKPNTLSTKFVSGDEFGIDLVCEDDPTWGAEGENASWGGDRWEGPQKDIFNLGFPTINIQNWKWKYFGLGGYSDKNYDKYEEKHTGFEKNIYFRVNAQLDQICLVEASVIRDEKKVKYVFNRKVSNSDYPEDWICVPKEHVRIFNRQPNGEWLENGPYCGPTQKELSDMENEYARRRVNEIIFAKQNNINNNVQ